MRLLSRMVLSFALLAGVLAAPTIASAHTRTGAGRATGYVYLNNNTAGTNTISGFSRAPMAL